ncbi:MAG: hypothetical protein C5S49_02490 [Candidatus Methanogaster sp.]|nr:MAG: hypothetical protein C5S49_02490 [ANME-2 cluster archaeon]
MPFVQFVHHVSPRNRALSDRQMLIPPTIVVMDMDMHDLFHPEKLGQNTVRVCMSDIKRHTEILPVHQFDHASHLIRPFSEDQIHPRHVLDSESDIEVACKVAELLQPCDVLLPCKIRHLHPERREIARMHDHQV